MNKIQRFTVYVLILISVGMKSRILNAQSIILRQNNDNGIYHSGERARVTFFLGENKSQSVSFKIQKNFGKKAQEQLKYTGDTLVVFDEIINEPTTIVFEAKSKSDSGSIGLIVDPEKFVPGTNRPKDFDAFWKRQKGTLRALPVKVKAVPVNSKDSGYECSDMEINCLGLKPARGYFAKPITTQPKSLPIVINFHAAGVNGDWCQSKPEIAIRFAKMGKGAIVFDLNAHGMLNGQPQAYYDSLNSGELNNYWLIGIENKNDNYFLGMYLRLLRTIDYLTSLPEWDGERILVVGESQGGGQSLVAAGLDNRVTAVVATVPAMCDWGGDLVGRKGAWPYLFETKNDREKMLATLPYFDAAHILKGSKATIVTEIGLIDQTCPSSAVYAVLNQAIGKKTILTVPYRAHHFEQTAAYKDLWEKTVYKVKTDFINDYLK